MSVLSGSEPLSASTPSPAGPPPEAGHLQPTGVRPPLVMSHGRGSWLWDEDGRAYLDFVQGWAVNALGHSPPVIARALAEQAERLLLPSAAFHNRPQLELSAALAAATGLDRVFLCSSGAEANEGAIKLARKWGRVHRGGAAEILTFEGAFHGRTLATMAASGRPGWDTLYAPPVPGFRRLPYGDLDAVADAIDDATAAIWLEPIQGEAGVRVPPAGFLSGLRRLADERGVLLLADEIQTGMGRTGRLLACEWEGVRPDILTLGKGLGGGVPLAAVLATEAACCLEPGDQGGTYAGNPLMAAVGLAVLREVTAPGFLERVRERGAELAAGLAGIAAGHAGCVVEGRGLLQALELGAPVAADVVERCRSRGLLLNGPRPSRLRFMPALSVGSAEIARLGDVLEGVLGEV